jgi:hypothetical protein
MTAAAAVRALPAAGRTARYGHVLAGVELDGPAREALASPVPAPRKVPERVSPAGCGGAADRRDARRGS